MLDFLYGHAANARRRWYERHPEARRRLRHPVISVGNLSVGGTGKTPLVTLIARWLLDQGERPAILTRGYGRRVTADGVTIVADGNGVLVDLDGAGDEPLMMARQLPGVVVCVGEDRHLAGTLAERALAATVHVLDDGFQHVQLARDFDILLTGAGEITNGRVIPRGRLREPKAAAARADYVVVVGADRETARTEAWELGVEAFSPARRRLCASAAPGALGAVAVAGIGQPQQFFRMLEEAGVGLAASLAFPDHHRYSDKDIRRIQSALETSGAQVVMTTEKDAVRFAALRGLPFELVTVPMLLEVADWEELTAALQHVLSERRHVA